MPTYSKETALYNTGAISTAIDNVELSIPTSISELENDTGYVTETYIPSAVPAVNITGLLSSDQIDVDALRAVLLQVATILIGESENAHIVAQGDRLSFMAGPNNEVAYVEVDGEGGTFHMTRSVVLKDMYFGEGMWKWYKRSNNNMSLKWMGGM